MVRAYGASDDLVEVEGSAYENDEIGCYDAACRIWFDDGTVIRVGYPKADVAVWYIVVEHEGNAHQRLKTCTDEDADPYSDVFEIDAEILRHEICHKRGGK